ncbi:conjugal transfer protein TraB [Hydrogenophilus thermoluteolus]|uniref:TraB/VirB10 family protein n=1 Tax=Hydrogenophilus thermoluteolus TaxID=297 RepID=UPI0024A2EBED|nr:TraB/VirB10 family protein [Hydrogenophilus thermoluteolus]GLW61537.1 conjugal transfer protein TraB [Hydrogenophilus thermoluteolus]
MSEENKIAERLQSPKAKQYLVLGTIGTVFLGLVFGSVAIWENQPSIIPQGGNEDLPTKNIAAPGAQVDPRDVWMAQSSQQLRQMEATIEALKQKLEEVERKSEQQKQAAQESQPQSLLPPLPPLPPMNPPQPEKATETPAATGKVDLPPLPPPQPREPGIAVFEVSQAATAATQEEAEQKGKVYIPSGSFMRAVLLGGLDAPTGGQAQQNPWPVLMRVHDNAFLPNRYRAKVKECFMLGSGYGDISSERAYIRLESISCVLNDGEVVDTAAKGYVVGEDGKAGMRGRLVSKQGQVLANALMTGIISGIGQGFQQSAMSYSTSALGTVGTVDTGKEFQAGIGAGIGRALDRLSQYYITLAEKMFPIIEVDAGRVVDVVLTKGVTLGLGTSVDEGDYSDIWKRGRMIMRKPLDPSE